MPKKAKPPTVRSLQRLLKSEARGYKATIAYMTKVIDGQREVLDRLRSEVNRTMMRMIAEAKQSEEDVRWPDRSRSGVVPLYGKGSYP